MSCAGVGECDVARFPDTLQFLHVLSCVDSPAGSPAGGSSPAGAAGQAQAQLPEQRAAKGLFRWEVRCLGSFSIPQN